MPSIYRYTDEGNGHSQHAMMAVATCTLMIMKMIEQKHFFQYFLLPDTGGGGVPVGHTGAAKN